MRIEDLRHDPEPEWTGERWGDEGRPVLLLNETGSDRSAWWPVAALLADDHAVAVLDLPEHTAIGHRADALAAFTARHGTRAPVVVGRGRAALAASVFAARYVAHAVVNVEQPLDAPADPAEAEAIAEVVEGRRPVACPYLSVFAAPPREGYEAWLRERLPRARCAVYGAGGVFPHLAEPARFTEDVKAIAR
jgi:pimeloyl-ACP methyl ester carboxylesterase